MAKAWGADKNCEVCHKGNPYAFTKKEAHKGMYINPGDFRVISETCGQCHDDRGRIRKDVEGLIPEVIKLSRVVSKGQRNHVPRTIRVIMSTLSGEIAGTRYIWNAQKTKNAIYSVRAVRDIDGILPDYKGVVKELKNLPPASNSDADSLLRNKCLKCHLWTKGEEKEGLYRSNGCSACHVIYSDKGFSETGDPTIAKGVPSHPLKHEITVKVPVSQCMHCHNNEGERIGMSYTGQIQAHLGFPYTNNGMPREKIYGINSIHIKSDIHYQRGMSCIDCHTSKEMHGDGNLYVRSNYEVSIRCESCHGTPYEYPSLKDSRGNKLANLVKRGNDLILVEKLTGREHIVPQLKRIMDRASLPLAMVIPAHLKDIKGRNKLECYTCHAVSAPQYYGYNIKRDDRRVSPIDWGIGIGEGEKIMNSPSGWDSEYIYIRWEDSPLGVDYKGYIAPFIPLYQPFFTHIDSSGRILSLNRALKTTKGLYSLSLDPVQPHSIRRQSRSCESCHNNPKAVGLGSDYLDLVAQGLSINFSLDRFVDEYGKPVSDTEKMNSRPFNKEEMDRMERINLCVACHKNMENAELWKKITDITSFAKTNKRHRDIINNIFIRGALSGTPKGKGTK
jgi:hypothetical protein